MPRQRQLRICREGLYYIIVFLAVLIGAVSRQLNLLMLVGCVMAGPLLFSLFYGRLTLGRVRVERRLPSHLHAGEPLRIDVTVRNASRWLGLWGLKVEDSVQREGVSGESARVGVFFPYVPASQSRQSFYEGKLARRGRYFFGPLRAATRFPLGLIRHSLIAAEHNELLVHPKLGQLNPGWEKMVHEHESGSQRITRRGMLEADFYGLREWRPGDSRRWIHWRTSARRGALIVRQFEQRRSQNLAILLDLWQPGEPNEQDLERVETAVSFVATLIAEVCRKPGAQLLIEVAARCPFSNAGSGSPVFLQEQMDALALVQAHEQPDFPRELGHALALVPSSTPTFIISTRSVDWNVLNRAAAERDSQLDGRQILAVDIAGGELASYFSPIIPHHA